MTDLDAKGLPFANRPGWQQAIIVGKERQTARVTSFRLRPDRPFAFRAGQYADLRLTTADGARHQRSFSIASAPEQGDAIELAIEQLDGGHVSSFLHDTARLGDAIELRAPQGRHFSWSVEDGGPLLLIGGGSGAVPLISMLRHRAARQAAIPALLFYSARVWDEVIFRDELIAMHDSSAGVELAFALTREPARRPVDFSRRLDMPIIADLLRRLPANPSLAFICGGSAFVEAAAQGLIDAGMPPVQIKTERFGA